jgi:hypothetical protein
MKKEIYTHCKNHKCGKKLQFPDTISHYCRNNNKCKNDHHNAIRKAKTDFADHVIETTLESMELEKKLNTILNKKRIRILPIDDLELMGIDLSSPLFRKVNIDNEDLTFIEFEFVNYQFFYFVMTDEVGIWKNNVAA